MPNSSSRTRRGIVAALTLAVGLFATTAAAADPTGKFAPTAKSAASSTPTSPPAKTNPPSTRKPPPASKPAATNPAPATVGGPSRGGQLVREGTSLTNQAGYFKVMGDHIQFVAAADGRRFRCLENLNLERVARLLVDNSDGLQWSITGSVTEYQGNNFLLISRALLKSKSGEATPTTKGPKATANRPPVSPPRTAAN